MFKVFSVIYIRIGVNLFDADLEALLNFGNLFMASRADIIALTTSYGSGVTLIVIGIIVPIYEEIVFRGVILKSCERYLNFKWANIFQAALFALIHENLFLFPIFFAFGIFTGLLVKKTGSLFGGILFHIINNLIAGVVIIAASHAEQMMNM
jgi:membrane protease YdiL (CAAX protease family)